KKDGIKTTILSILENRAGPPEYKLAKDADVTVILYAKRKVVANHAFKKGELNAKAIDTIMADVPKILPAPNGDAGPSEGSKLIGAFELTKMEGQEEAPHWRIEFLKDGKLRMTSKKDDAEVKVEGTYALTKDQLTVTVVENGETSDTKTVTVKELTAEAL